MTPTFKSQIVASGPFAQLVIFHVHYMFQSFVILP